MVGCVNVEAANGSIVTGSDADPDIVEEKKNGTEIDKGRAAGNYSGEKFKGGVSDESPGDAIGYAHRKLHDDNRDKGGQGFGEIVPIDLADHGEHVTTDNNKHGGNHRIEVLNGVELLRKRAKPRKKCNR